MTLNPFSALILIETPVDTPDASVAAGANETVQWICVLTVLLMVVRWLWRRYHRRSQCSSCCSTDNKNTKEGSKSNCRETVGECADCPLKNNCRH